MKCIIDAREAYRLQKTGKGQWTAGFLRELSARDIDLTILVDQPGIAGTVFLHGGLRWHFHAASYVRRSNPDLYIAPTSFIVPFLLGRSIAFAPVIHDLIAFMDEPHDRKARLIERLLLPIILRRATFIATISASTKKDLHDRFPSLDASIVVPVYAGPMTQSPPPSRPDAATILCAGTLCPRKNQARLIRAYAQLPQSLRSRFRLLLIGARGWDDDEILRLVEQTEGVSWMNYVTDAEYQRLLSTAAVLAYPSLYEGFGLQVLDALQRGTPVLTSSRGSLKEVVGNAALTVDPESEQSIAAGLEALLKDSDLAASLSAAGPAQADKFSWKKTVDLFLSGLKSVVY